MPTPVIVKQRIPISSGRKMQALARQVVRKITRYPYFVVVRGFDRAGVEQEIKSLALMIGSLGQASQHSPQAGDQLSFTRVTINPDALKRTKKATAYSRTHLPIRPHTDSSYLPNPHDLVAFQCVVADKNGGENAMVPVDDVLKRLDAADEARLRQPVFPFSRGYFPVLEGEGGQTRIRYYRTQVEQAIKDGACLGTDDRAILDRLDQILEEESTRHTFKLKEGEAVFFANKRVLHARTGFDAGSDRTLFRVRYHADLGRAARGGLMRWLRGLFVEGERMPAPKPDRIELLKEQAAAHPEDVALLRKLAKELAGRGDFTGAEEWNARALKLAPEDHDMLLLSSCLKWEAADHGGAQEALRTLAQHHPFLFPKRQDAVKPTVLRLRGFKNIKYVLRGGVGRYAPRLQGGHFSVTHFLDKRHFNVVSANVFDEAAPWPEGKPLPDVVLNCVACADRMKDSLKALEGFLKAHPDLPVINHPANVLKTSREENYRRLGAIEGVVFPNTVRLEAGSADAALAAIKAGGFTYPLILRPTETHTGVDVAKVEDEAGVHRYFESAQPDRAYYIIQFHDLRDSAGRYRKSRTFCIDGTYYPVASLVHDDWNVHSGDRYAVMADDDASQAAERDYLANFTDWLGAENIKRLHQARDLMELEFFGVDFCKLPDGRLFIFECNAAMRHNYDHAGAFPYTEPYLDKVSSAFDAMLKARTGAMAHDWVRLNQRAQGL